jgi:AcrR family transcriptional regulator
MSTAASARPPRLSRDEQREQRKRQLLEAAWVLFCEKGYEAVTIDAVAEHAGYSRMPVYSIFGDKQNLYFELWQLEINELVKVMLGPLQAGAPLRANLEKLARIIVGHMESLPPRNREALAFVVQTIVLSRPELGERMEQTANQVIDHFAGIIRGSKLAPGEKLRSMPETIAAQIVAQINGLATVQFQTRKMFVKQRDLAEVFLAIAIKDE